MGLARRAGGDPGAEGLIGVDRGAEAGEGGADLGQEDFGVAHQQGGAIEIQVVVDVDRDMS